ncbi:MAG TPA: cupin-like domain-containing protein [Polyangia bacterium]|nr:cupin-like domain-containing protein [Polyangia bacterium]
MAESPSQTGPLIDVDWASFDRGRVQAVRHRLTTHPLLTRPPLIELGKRLDAIGRVRTHSNEATAGTPFNYAPSMHPNQKSADETLRNIEGAAAWMSLLNVQTDDVYRTLVDEVLDSIKPEIDRVDPGMCYRGGWIFITSPNTVTPFHMDFEHNFILQIQGKKRIYVWEPDDTVAVTTHARELFHYRKSRDLIVWREELRERAHVFDLEPGQGAFMPTTSPHMVENGDNSSITASFTYYTDWTRKLANLHRVRARLRELGVSPPPIGAVPPLDAAIDTALGGIERGKNLLRKALGRTVTASYSRYALSLYS